MFKEKAQTAIEFSLPPSDALKRCTLYRLVTNQQIHQTINTS